MHSENDRPCTSCGKPLAVRSHGGICPACLLGEAAQSLGTIPDGAEGTGGEGSFVDAAMTMANLPGDPLEGTSIGEGGRYKILQRIGEGGFGTVYMAEQSAPMRRRVALKVLKAGVDTQQVVARFEAERQALAMMYHPNIAHIYDGGTTEHGRPFFVMELVRGIPITRFCERENLDISARLRLFLQVCRALQHAHQKGIIHRDIKPGNVLVTVQDGAEPVPKVIDFGIAKAVETPLTEKTLFTRFEQMLGTPAYMSPEQAGSEAAGDIDTRSDIYSLGVLLYELLTGTTPFEATTLQKAAFDEVRRILREEEPPKPSTRLTDLRQRGEPGGTNERSEPKKDIARDLDWIAMKALEKDRRRRYETANGLAKDVVRFLENEPVSAGPPTLAYRFSKWRRRNARWVVIGATFSVIMAAATIYSARQASIAIGAEARASENFTNLQTAYDNLDTANTTARQAQQKNQHLLVRTLLEKGTKQFNDADVTGLITLQEAVVAAEGDQHLLQQAMEFWTLAHAWLPGAVHEVFDAPYAVAISPDESVVAWCDATSLHFYSSTTGQQTSFQLDRRLLELELLPKQDHRDLTGLVFSPDGSFLAIHNPEDGIAQVWGVKTQSPTTGLLVHPHSQRALPMPEAKNYWGGCTGTAFSPSGHQLCTLRMNGSVCLWNLESGKLATPPWIFPSFPKTVEFSPSGKRLAIGTGHAGLPTEIYPPEVAIYDLAKPEKPELQMRGLFYRANKLRFIDENRLVIRATNHIHLWDLETNKINKTPGGFFEDIALSPDRNTIAIGDRDGTASLFASAPFEPIGERLGHGGGVRSLAFSEDGTALATGGLDGTVQLWTTGSLSRRFGIWPQPGTIDQMSVPSNGGSYYLTKSRTRDESQPPCALLRSFAKPLHRQIGRVPSGSTVADVSHDGAQVLVISSDRMKLMTCDTSGQVNGNGPNLDPSSNGFTAAAFSHNEEAIVYSTTYENRQEFRSWDSAAGKPAAFFHQVDAWKNRVLGVLPANPPQVMIGSNGWQVDFFKLSTGEETGSINLANRPCCYAIANRLGWYAVGDWSGKVARFAIKTREELLPPIRLDNLTGDIACSGDNRWLITTECHLDGTIDLRAWLLDDDVPFRNLKLPLPYEGGKIFPVDDRGFVFQNGDELQRFDLPQVSLQRNRVVSATAAALAVRKDESDELHLLNRAEFRQARATGSPNR